MTPFVYLYSLFSLFIFSSRKRWYPSKPQYLVGQCINTLLQPTANNKESPEIQYFHVLYVLTEWFSPASWWDVQYVNLKLTLNVWTVKLLRSLPLFADFVVFYELPFSWDFIPEVLSASSLPSQLFRPEVPGQQVLSREHQSLEVPQTISGPQTPLSASDDHFQCFLKKSTSFYTY